MKFLFYVGHPAHYHNVSVVMKKLSSNGHEIVVVAREKDVLLDLTRDLPYEQIRLPARRSGGRLGLAREVLSREIKMFRIMRRTRPDVVVGTDIVITHVGRLLAIPSVVLNEDDVDAIPSFTNLGIRFATTYLCPASSSCAPYEHKTITYEGYHELAYLHPDHFVPDRKPVAHLFGDHDRFFLIRFSALAAHHDRGVDGISDGLAQRIVDLFAPHGVVHITSERPLSPALEPLRMRLEPHLIHHALYHADMYVGDSQTMTAEAAVLGTPSVRFNDFVGRLGYLEELEHRYGLTRGVRTSEPERLLEQIETWLRQPDLAHEWQRKRARMLEEKINVADFWTWFLESYPKSIEAAERHLAAAGTKSSSRSAVG